VTRPALGAPRAAAPALAKRNGVKPAATVAGDQWTEF
jgi:hypothetical protein